MKMFFCLYKTESTLKISFFKRCELAFVVTDHQIKMAAAVRALKEEIVTLKSAALGLNGESFLRVPVRATAVYQRALALALSMVKKPVVKVSNLFYKQNAYGYLTLHLTLTILLQCR